MKTTCGEGASEQAEGGGWQGAEKGAVGTSTRLCLSVLLHCR